MMTANTLWRANLWTGVLSPCRLLAGILMYSSLVPAYMSGSKDRPSSLSTWYVGGAAERTAAAAGDDEDIPKAAARITTPKHNHS